jgi:hypothetical protein
MRRNPLHRRGPRRTWTLFEDRASTQVLGFALMFSITMTTFAIYQADVVPHQNEEAEFEHNQAMAEEMGKLRGAIRRGGHGVAASTTLRTGVEYPSRAVAVNGPDPRGRLATTGSHTVGLTDIEPADGSYWTGGSPDLETRLVSYDADYNHIEGASYHLEHGVAVKRFPNGEQRILGNPAVIDGTRIDLTLLSGELERTGRTTTVEFRPVSTTTSYRTLAGASGELTLPTRLTAAQWESLVPSHVDVTVDTAPDPNEVTLTLDSSRTYQLRLTKLKLVGEAGTASQAPVEMLTPETATPLSVNPEESTALTVTARDEYGNPVPGVEVEFDPSSAAIGSTATRRTGSDGEATYRFSPSSTVDGTVDADVVSGSGSTTFDLEEPSTATGQGPLPVYTGGQMAEDLDDVDGLVLSEAHTVPSSDEDCLLLGDTGGGVLGGLIGGANCDTDEFRTAQGQLQFTTDGETYWLRYVLVDTDGDGDVTDGDDGVSVTIESAASDDTVFAGDLDDTVANDIFNSTGVDVLDESNYDAGSVDWDNDAGCYADCGVLDGPDQNGPEATSPYDDGDGDGGTTGFDEVDLANTAELFVEEALGRVTVTPE